MLSFNNADYTYVQSEAPSIHGVSFDLAPGSFHFLCGPSGAGKTTVFRLAYMDMMPTSGKVSVFGKDITTLSRDEIAHMRRRMGLVFQDARLLNHLTVKENVSLPLSLHGTPTREQENCVTEILDWVGLGHKLDEYPDRLSGGERQRVGIARAVVNRPKLLIADEPTGNVDAAMGTRILHLFTELHKHGTTVMIATHDRSLVKSFGKPCLYLENGRLIREVAA